MTGWPANFCFRQQTFKKPGYRAQLVLGISLAHLFSQHRHDVAARIPQSLDVLRAKDAAHYHVVPHVQTVKCHGFEHGLAHLFHSPLDGLPGHGWRLPKQAVDGIQGRFEPAHS